MLLGSYSIAWSATFFESDKIRDVKILASANALGGGVADWYVCIRLRVPCTYVRTTAFV